MFTFFSRKCGHFYLFRPVHFFHSFSWISSASSKVSWEREEDEGRRKEGGGIREHFSIIFFFLQEILAESENLMREKKKRRRMLAVKVGRAIREIIQPWKLSVERTQERERKKNIVGTKKIFLSCEHLSFEERQKWIMSERMVMTGSSGWVRTKPWSLWNDFQMSAEIM